MEILQGTWLEHANVFREMILGVKRPLLCNNRSNRERDWLEVKREKFRSDFFLRNNCWKKLLGGQQVLPIQMYPHVDWLVKNLIFCQIRCVLQSGAVFHISSAVRLGLHVKVFQQRLRGHQPCLAMGAAWAPLMDRLWGTAWLCGKPSPWVLKHLLGKTAPHPDGPKPGKAQVTCSWTWSCPQVLLKINISKRNRRCFSEKFLWWPFTVL